jgi:hypothetical protein
MYITENKTFRMSIYMLNKIQTELEILASKVDPSAAKNEYKILESFNFDGKYLRTGR